MSIKKQRGLTLVELMIVGVLSLIIMYFVGNIMIASSRTATQSEGVSQAQENGRFILNWLQMNMRSAGMPYPSDRTNERVQPFADKCTGTIDPGDPNGNCSFDSNSSAQSDRIAIQRTFVSDISFRTDTSNRNCSGEEITSLADGDLITDLYWIETSATGQGGTLMCATYSNSSNEVVKGVQQIANGIDGMQVLYGIKKSADHQYRSDVARYVSLSEMSANDFNNIGAVQIAILTRSFTERNIEEKKRSYILLDASPVTFDDSIFRHIQTTTIYLANE